MSLKPCVFIDLKTGKRYNYDEFRQFLYENPKFWEQKKERAEPELGLMKKAALTEVPGNYEVAALQVIMSKGITKDLLFSMYGKNTGFAEYDRKQIEGEVQARKWMIRKTGPKTVDVYAELVETYMQEYGNPDIEYDFTEITTAIENAIQEFRSFPEMARRILEIAGEYDVSKYEDEYVKYMMQQEEAQEQAEQEEVERKSLSEEDYKELERQIAEEYIKREQEDAEESEKMFGKPLSQEEYDKMRKAWDEEFAQREFTRSLTPEQKQALANLELAMLGLSNAKEAYENEVKKQARGSQQELFGSNPLGFVQNESPQALKDKLDRLKAAVDMAQVVADKALAAYQREMGMGTRQGELFGEQKPGAQITFKNYNGNELVGERIKTGNSIYDQIDLILVKNGLQYEIYELASGLKLSDKISFSAQDAIEEILNSGKLQEAASRLYDKIYKNENLKRYGAAGKVTLINQSEAYTNYSNQRKDQEQAENENRPFVHTEEERKALLAIADSAEKEGIDKAASMIRVFANAKQGIKFQKAKTSVERANEIVDQYRIEKIKEEARKAGLPYPSDLIERRNTGREWFKLLSIADFAKKDKARENFYKVPEEIRDMMYEAYRKATEIYNYYGYVIPGLQNFVPQMHRYVSIAGQSISETDRADKYDRELEKDIPEIEAINALYEREKDKLSEAKPDEKVERPPVTTKTEKKPRTQTIKDTKLADAAAKNAEKLKGSLDELNDAFNDFFDEIKKPGPATLGGLRVEVIEKAAKLIGVMIKAGVYGFSDIVIAIQSRFGDLSDEMFYALKKGYLSIMTDVDEDVLDSMDSVKDVKNAALSDFFEVDEVEPVNEFEKAIRDSIANKQKLNIVALRKLMPGKKDTDVQEAVENVLVAMGREVAQMPITDSEKMTKLIDIYDNQPTLAQRDSTKFELQQYSTPLPYAFIASSFAAAKNPTLTLEPSAGNGALTIAIDPAKVVVNEIDKDRLANLQGQGFADVTNQDALLPFDGTYDAVVMNPPFGSQGMKSFGTETKYQLTGLDPIMTANALESMTNNGVAAIVVGGHTSFAEDGIIESRKDRIFLNYLYHYYNVLDVINVDGSLYYKQGTTYPTRLILINGRKQTPGGIAPIRSDVTDSQIAPIGTFQDLLKRVQNAKEYLLQSQLDAQLAGRNGSNGGSTGEGKGGDGQRSTGTSETTVSFTGKGTSGTGRGTGQSSGRGTSTKSNVPGSESGANVGATESTGPLGETTEQGSETGLGESGVGTEFEGRGAEGGLQGSESRRNLEESDIDIEAEKSPYQPMSKSKPVGTMQPTAMAAETRKTLNALFEQYGDIDEFVATELGYKTLDELYKALSAEQVDAVAMIIAQLKTGQSLIVGDMTGVGKGRIAAAIIRYGVRNGKTPIFITEKSGLFSDMYRDLKSIGSQALNPFILNADGAITEYNENTETTKTIYKPVGSAEIKKAAINQGKIPSEYKFLMTTYSQFGDPKKSGDKRSLVSQMAANNGIIIMDESHNAAGELSATGSFVQGLVNSASGALFLSATFAKKPENMGVYAIKTAMRDTGLSTEKLINAIKEGGVPLQEILSAQLAQSGQMIRRERDFDGVEMKFSKPEDKQVVRDQRQKADEVIKLMRSIIAFQRLYVKSALEGIKEELKQEGMRADITKGTKDLGIQNTPFASKVFLVVNQLLFSLKAQEVAELAIAELKAGRKPVIGFENTMEAFLQGLMGDEKSDSNIIPHVDFSLTLLKGLDKTLEYTAQLPSGANVKQVLSPEDLGERGAKAYYELRSKIQNTVSGLTISPIDVITQTLQRAGYSVGEITGRNTFVELLDGGGAIIKRKPSPNKKELVAKFNAGQLDVILLNSSGSTGLSMHASQEFSDQRQRIMIIAQPPLNVNTFIQMMGRIDRTGQKQRGAYNIFSSGIPAEGRMHMMLAKKIASLFANTTAQQKSNSVNIDVVDFQNKYGDIVVIQFLLDNPDINQTIGDPLNLGQSETIPKEIKPDSAAEVLKRVALLTTSEQEAFYSEVSERYQKLINYLDEQGENDLRVTSMPLQAETIASIPYFEGKHTGSPFGEDAVMEVVESNVLKKPVPIDKIQSSIDRLLENKTPEEWTRQKVKEINDYYEEQIKDVREKYEESRDEEIQVKIDKIESDLTIYDQFPTEQEAEAAKQKMRDDVVDTVTEAYSVRTSNAISRLNNQKSEVLAWIRTMQIGKQVNVPVIIDTKNQTYSPFTSQGIVMGIDFGGRTKNPYAASNITINIAVKDTRGVMKIPVSQKSTLEIIGLRSTGSVQKPISEFLNKWDEDVKKIKNREIRFILTGNILMGYGQNPGQLITFTDSKNKVRKGVMYRPGQVTLESLSGQVPVANAIEKLKEKREIKATGADVVLEYAGADRFRISVAASKKLGGDFFLNEKLRQLSEDGDFVSRNYPTKRMVATYGKENFTNALKVLEEKFHLTIPGEAISREIIDLVNERMKSLGQVAVPKGDLIGKAETQDTRKNYKPAIREITRVNVNGQDKVLVKIYGTDRDTYLSYQRIAQTKGGDYSRDYSGFVFDSGSKAYEFQHDVEQQKYEEEKDNVQIPTSLFDKITAKIDELIERERNLPPGRVALGMIVPIPPQVAKAISIGALRAAKAVIMAAKAANNFTKKTMQDALAAAEQYVRNYMSDPTKFKPSQVEDMVKRVSKLIQPVNPVDVAVEVVTENSELVAEITKATDKAFEKMSALIAKEGMKQARKQAINLMKTILGGAKVPLNPKLIEKILAKFPNSNTDKAMLNFIEYAVGMVQSAEKIRMLQSLIDKAKSELDKSYAGAEMKARLKPLLRTIEAHKVDPDKMDILGRMLYGFILQMAGKNYKSVSIQNLVEALIDQGAYIDQQTKIRRRAMMQARVDRMIDSGALPAGTSVDDYEQMLADQAEQDAQNQTTVPPGPAQRSETADLLIPEITALMGQARDKAANTGTPFVKRMMRWTGKINLDTLTDNELKRLHNILNDYIELDDLSDLGVYAARGEAQERLSRLSTLGNKFRQYKGDVTKMSLNNLLENVSSSENAKDTLRAELYQREELLFGDVKKKTDDNLQALEAHIIENDMDERSVRSTEIFNILAQAGSQNSTWQAWREAMMINWNKYLNKKMEEQRLMSSGYTKIFEKDLIAEEIRIAQQTLNILENDFDPEQHDTLATTIDRSQAELAQMVRNFYAEISEEFRQNTAAFFSKLFDPMENPMYVSLNVIDRLGKGGIDESYSPTLTDTVFEEARIDRRESRTAIERTTFTNNAVVYGTDLLANFRKRYYQTLYQARLTEELFVMDRMIKSEQFRNLFDPQYSERTTKVILSFMEGVVDGQRYFGYIGVSDQPMIKKLVNGNIGAVLVDLGQFLKQSVGSLQLLARVNYKLTGWALKTAFSPTEAQRRWLDSTTTLRERTYQSESLVSKQYAELNKFAGKTWAKKLLVKIGDAIKNTRNFMAKHTIEKADRFVSAAALFAGYANSLHQQGLIQSPSEINWDEEIKNPNYNALATAENLSDELNVPSNQTTKAEVLRSEKKSINDFTLKEINWMLGQFDLNAYNNLRNNWRTIMDMSGTVDSKERWNATAKVFGILLNTQTYTAAKVLMDVLYQQAAISLALWALGIDFEDEDEEEKARRQKRSFIASALIGVFNLFVGRYGNIYKIIPRLAFATGFALFYKDKEQTEENKGTLKDPNTDLFYDPTGVPVVDLAVRQMEQIGKNIKKEDDAYELARTAGMLASFVTGFATIERITTKTTKEMSESPRRKDAKLAEKTDLLGEKKFDERKTKLFKYLKEGHEDYAKTIFEKMVGPVASKNYSENYNKTFQAIMDHLQTDRVRSQMRGSDYFGALAYGLGFAGKEINVTLPGEITGSIDVLMGRGYLNEGDIRRIVQRYEDQYQEDMKMIETLKEVNPILGNALENFFKPEGPGEGSLPQSYSIMRRMKKKGSLAYDIPE